MKKGLLFFWFLVFLFFFLFFNHQANAQGKNLSAITVINPIRGSGLGHEKDDLAASLKAQWQVTKEAQVDATWLFQYGALEDKKITDFAKDKMSNQEFGLLFEIDRNFTEKANVQFRGQGPWYFSDGLLLVSYDLSERRKLIDAAFAKFKEVFGYYPKTVGAWWIGADSLSYMQERYGITAALRAADQFDLDAYSIWGTPWSIPYLSSQNNQAIPAASFSESAKVVILQWAARDPFYGYNDPLYSLQDYSMKNYTVDYVDYLASVFLAKPLGNLVIGLENGGTLETFNGFYKNMLNKGKDLEKNKKAEILLAKDYAAKFLKQKKVFADKSYFLSNAYNSSNQAFWYISKNYRVTIQKDKDSIYLIDVRDYGNKEDEDFYLLPNSQPTLRINAPPIIDTIRFAEDKLLIKKAKEPIVIEEDNQKVYLFAGKEKIAAFSPISFKLFGENGERDFSFVRKSLTVNPLNILFMFYIFYFILIFYLRKDLKKIIIDYVFLLIPFLLSSSFLISNSVFLFDRKEVFLLKLVPFSFLSLANTIFLFKLIPFVILLILHYLFIFKYPKKIKKIIYYAYLYLTLLLYLNLWYFPLDKTTYSSVILALVLIALLLFSFAIYVSLKKKSKKTFAILFLAILLFLFSISLATFFSRSKYALTSFEKEALEKIGEQQKDVLYVEQIDYSIKPIYKAVKPMLYENNLLAEKITNRKWEKVVRPENNILKIDNYDNKLIYIPKYLGSDLSTHEMGLLKLRKIFDNAQIQIFEKI